MLCHEMNVNYMYAFPYTCTHIEHNVSNCVAHNQSQLSLCQTKRQSHFVSSYISGQQYRNTALISLVLYTIWSNINHGLTAQSSPKLY